jgi:hypothetical protein
MTFSPSDLRSLLQAGTPRPWRTGNGKGAAAVKAKDCAIYINVRTCEVDECVKRWQEDARLIVAAVNALPALLEENERLAAEVERLRVLCGEAVAIAEAQHSFHPEEADRIAEIKREVGL